MMIASYELRMN